MVREGENRMKRVIKKPRTGTTRTFNSMKMKGKLLSAFAAVIALFLLSTVISLGALFGSRKSFNAFYQEGFVISNTTHGMRADVQELSKNVANGILAPHKSEIQQYLDQAVEALGRLKEGMAYLEENVQDPALLEKLATLKSDLSKTKTTQECLFAMAQAGDVTGARNQYFTNYEPVLQEVETLMVEMDGFTASYVEEMHAAALMKISFTFTALLILGGLALVLTFLVAGRLTRSIVKPVEEVTAAAQEMAKGNLHAAELLTYESQDELGLLADSMRSTVHTLESYVTELSDTLALMAQGDLTRREEDITDFQGDFASIKDSLLYILSSFNSTLSDIKNSAQQVDAGADQVAQGAQNLSQGAVEQAASTEELAASITEIDHRVAQAGEFDLSDAEIGRAHV